MLTIYDRTFIQCIYHFTIKLNYSLLSVELLLQPFYGSLDFVQDYPGEPVPER